MKREEQRGILSDVVDIPTLLKEVALHPKTITGKLLVATGLKKKKREMLYLRNTNLSTNHQLTLVGQGLLLTNSGGSVDDIMNAIHENTYTMAAYVATAVQNQNKPAPSYLIDTIADEFTNEELKLTIQEIHKRLRFNDFYSAVALTKSLDLM
jgi:hypothetical protein